VLHRENAFSDLFVAYLVMRNNQIQEDLCRFRKFWPVSFRKFWHA